MSVWVVTQDDTGSLPDVDVDLFKSCEGELLDRVYTRKNVGLKT